MKHKAVIETDDYKDFEFFEDGNGKYMVGKDAGATAIDGWIPLYFTECEQEPKSEWLEHEDDKRLKEIQEEAHGSLNALMATLYNKGYQDGEKALAEHHKLCRDEADGTDNVLDKIRAEIESYRLSEDELSDMDEDSVKWGMKIAYDIVNTLLIRGEVGENDKRRN